MADNGGGKAIVRRAVAPFSREPKAKTGGKNRRLSNKSRERERETEKGNEREIESEKDQNMVLNLLGYHHRDKLIYMC